MNKYQVIIGHAVYDENGRSSGGKPGNQTGRELRRQEWYLRTDEPWTAVFRPISMKDAENIAAACEDAVDNMAIGYDQNDRTSLFEEAKKKDFKIYEISKPCNTDCSALVAVCINAAGIPISKDMYTGNEKAAIEATGKFRTLTDKSYRLECDHLRRGDIIQKPHHTVTVLEVKYIMRREISYQKGHIMNGADVRQIQKELSAQDYMKEVTGRFGKKTDSALRMYQRDHGLTPDGIFGKKTALKMGFAWEE